MLEVLKSSDSDEFTNAVQNYWEIQDDFHFRKLVREILIIRNSLKRDNVSSKYRLTTYNS
jgi:hypothetical protein